MIHDNTLFNEPTVLISTESTSYYTSASTLVHIVHAMKLTFPAFNSSIEGISPNLNSSEDLLTIGSFAILYKKI